MQKIESGELPLAINPEKQARHMLAEGETEKPDGRSYLTITFAEAQDVVERLHGKGDLSYIPSSNKFTELVTDSKTIGVDGYSKSKTSDAFIAYSKTGTHLIPTKKGRGKK